MIENLPFYIVSVFVITTVVTVGIFQAAVKRAEFNSRTANIINFSLAFWLIFQGTLAVAGFYQRTDTLPPRLFAFAVFPALAAIIALFVFARGLIEKLDLKTLTFLSVIRIPVELVLFWLFQNGQIPEVMTFEGRNFDIVSGITAPFVAWLAFRHGTVNRPLLLVWNVICLILLFIIVIHAALSAPSPIQQMAFDQPNRAVLFFPFIWLPSTIVPIVLFSHLAILWKLLRRQN
jgi:hypothetical protein